MFIRFPPGFPPTLPWLLPLAALWGQLYFAASYAWIHGEYYSYGWYVPPVALLFYGRLLRETKLRPLPRLPWPILCGGGLLLGSLLAIFRVLERVDPGWALPLWAHASVVAGVTAAVTWRLAGREALPRLVPILAFALTALKLPGKVEGITVKTLTHSVIHSSSWLLNAMGKPVAAVGNQLELQGAMVQVTEGCSGVRSLQSFLMAALFFGEWMRLDARGRFLMLAAGLATAWLLNILRACSLALIQFQFGEEAFHRAHDSVGLAAFIAGSLILLGVSSHLAARPAGPPAIAVRRKVERGTA